MEVQFMEHIRHSLLFDCNKDLVIEKLLNLTLEIISLLTREDFIVVRKGGGHVTEGSANPVSDRCTPSPIVKDPPQSQTEEKILDSVPIYNGETEEVPRDPQDVEVSFYVTDYDYSEEHKGAVIVPPQPHSSAGECSNTHRPARCETPLYSQDCIKEETRVMTPDYQADPGHRIFHPQYKEEETPLDPVGSGEGSSRNFLEPCETPQYPDCMEEETKMIPQEYQAEPVDVMFNPQCKEEDISAPISSGPTVSCNTEVSHPRKKNPSSDLNTLQIPHRDCVYTCTECKKCFAKMSTLNKHKQIHNKNHICTQCKQQVQDSLSLLQHFQTCRNNTPYVCGECGKSFKFKSRLITHMPSHTGEKPYSCPECTKRFSQKYALVKHLKTHTGEKPYSCPECTETFSQKCVLVEHRKTHSGVKPYSCPECTKRFSLKFILTRHLKTHSGEKPYSCPECTKTFSQKSYLAVHLKTHTGEQPYSCPYCPKRYTWKPNLIYHLRTHSEKKPFSCLECGKGYTSKSGLDKHRLIHRTK